MGGGFPSAPATNGGQRELRPDIVRIGSFWTDTPPVEIDAVALAGRSEEAALVGEAKWSRRLNGVRIARELQEKVHALPRVAPDVRLAICAREQVDRAPANTLAVTAAEIFA